jgi:hypothetical protein
MLAKVIDSNQDQFTNDFTEGKYYTYIRILRGGNCLQFCIYLNIGMCEILKENRLDHRFPASIKPHASCCGKPQPNVRYLGTLRHCVLVQIGASY